MKKLTKHEAAWEIQKTMDTIYSLKSVGPEAPEFLRWRMEAEAAIEYVFGEQSRRLKHFEAIDYSLNYLQGLEGARFFLQSMINLIHNYWPEEAPLPNTVSTPIPPNDTVTDRLTNTALMRRAIEIARKSVSEAGKVSPKVGAVVARDGEIIGEAYRGELAPGNHAEFTLLEKKLGGQTLAGATLYTTLEPCTSRNHPKQPCAQWIVDRRIKKVVIGTLDRNPDIRGRGEIYLLDAGIEVARFDSDLLPVIEELNRDFIRDIKKRIIAAAGTSDPVGKGEVGPNGFPVGYTSNGDKVEWIPADDDGYPDEAWPHILRRNDKDILGEYSELQDRVWYVRKLIMFENFESGKEERRPESEPFIQSGLEKMRKMEEQYGAEDLVYDDIEWGIIQGKMAALAWVMGSDWEGAFDT
jgi:pyrimidine deaminase RibD-like protein